MRPMIEAYVVLAIPLAAFIEMILKKRRAILACSSIAAIFLIWLNIFQLYQYETGALDYERMNTRLYLKQFGKIEKIEGFDKYVSEINSNSAKEGER